jgi:hypothetical protein
MRLRWLYGLALPVPQRVALVSARRRVEVDPPTPPSSYRPPARELTPFGDFQLRPSHLVTGRVSYMPPVKASPEEARAAALCVTGRATDPDDARELLSMLGLLEVLSS